MSLLCCCGTSVTPSEKSVTRTPHATQMVTLKCPGEGAGCCVVARRSIAPSGVKPLTSIVSPTVMGTLFQQQLKSKEKTPALQPASSATHSIRRLSFGARDLTIPASALHSKKGLPAIKYRSYDRFELIKRPVCDLIAGNPSCAALSTSVASSSSVAAQRVPLLAQPARASAQALLSPPVSTSRTDMPSLSLSLVPLRPDESRSLTISSSRSGSSLAPSLPFKSHEVRTRCTAISMSTELGFAEALNREAVLREAQAKLTSEKLEQMVSVKIKSSELFNRTEVGSTILWTDREFPERADDTVHMALARKDPVSICAFVNAGYLDEDKAYFALQPILGQGNIQPKMLYNLLKAEIITKEEAIEEALDLLAHKELTVSETMWLFRRGLLPKEPVQKDVVSQLDDYLWDLFDSESTAKREEALLALITSKLVGQGDLAKHILQLLRSGELCLPRIGILRALVDLCSQRILSQQQAHDEVIRGHKKLFSERLAPELQKIMDGVQEKLLELDILTEEEIEKLSLE